VGKFMQPGLRLRQAREKLGLTYRDVERASYELAAVRGRPDFILHISRLADIESHGVVPGLHKLYTLAALYHLSPVEIFRWYDAPLEDCFHDGASFDPRRTELLSRMVEKWGHFEGVLTNGHNHHTYGYIGISDRRMVPILRPGSIVLVDTSKNNVEDGYWTTEHDRPMYFVDVRAGYRCGWFHQDGGRLVMHPHPLSHCPPEAWRTPEEAEIVGQLQGLLRI
jgi:transcriptional regulator with XRE-family HTH domain